MMIIDKSLACHATPYLTGISFNNTQVVNHDVPEEGFKNMFIH